MLRLAIQTFQPLAAQRRILGQITRNLSSATMVPTPWTPNTYPATHRSDHVDVYKSAAKGEVRVADPYQWLEEYSDETDKWTTSQALFTRSYLDKNTDRQKLEDVIRTNTDYAKVTASILHFSLPDFDPA